MRAKENRGPVEEMRAKLLDWLNRRDAACDQLLDWLEGYDLPGVDRDDHTFLWLVRALPPDGDRQTVCRQLAGRVARILDDLLRTGVWSRPPMVLANLLLLCANLRRPQELAEPLWKLLQNLRSIPVIPSHWDETARVALRSALAANQIDSRLKDVWIGLVQGKQDNILVSNRFAGWRGLSRMPSSPQELAKPNMDAIGIGLREMADFFQSGRGMRIRFRKLITEVISFFGGKDFNRRLIEQANKCEWPLWAVQCLILYEEFEELGTSEKRGIRAVIWNSLLECFPSNYYQVEGKRVLCSGEIVEVVLSKEHLNYVRGLAKAVEPAWKECPFDSPTSIKGFVQDTLAGRIYVGTHFQPKNQGLRQYFPTFCQILDSSTRTEKKRISEQEIEALKQARSTLAAYSRQNVSSFSRPRASA